MFNKVKKKSKIWNATIDDIILLIKNVATWIGMAMYSITDFNILCLNSILHNINYNFAINIVCFNNEQS